MKSVYNHVARDLMESYDWTWRQIRRALEAAEIAVDSVDVYREAHAAWYALHVWDGVS